MKKQMILLTLLALGLGLVWIMTPTRAQESYPVTATDQTPTEPLAHPTPSSFQPRYISGFGLDDTFTVFFEDRDNGGQISYNQTTSGPQGFALNSTATNIADTHFVVKDWPVTISSTLYAYRGWGSVGNNPQHHFYVSNNLITWTLSSTFTIPNAPSFAGARGFVYYGFHDAIKLNGTYYAFGESNAGQTMIVSSTTGTDDWVAFDSVGGTQATDGPLQLPESGTPSGSFVKLKGDRGYGKIHVRGNDSGFYLAINTAAKPSLSPAAREAAFINPANWTWNDGTTGLPATPLLSETTEHDLRECWLVPQSDPNADWIIIYDADFGSGDGGKALGYFTVAPPRPVDHFTFAVIGDQVETKPFTITVTAEDAYDNTVASYTDPVTLADSAGAINPTLSGSFAGGVLTQVVAINAAQNNVVITATHTTTPTINGVSLPFDVKPLRVKNLDTGERFLTIQEAIDDPETLDTHTISATTGVYTENVNIDKRIILQGLGSGDDPSSATIIKAANANDPVIQIQASGASASERLIVRNLRVTGATGSGNPGSGIEVDGSRSFVTFENVAAVGNGGYGIAIDATGDVQDIRVLNSTLSNNGYSGFRVPSSLGSLSGLVISGSQFYSNTSAGLMVYGSGERNLSVNSSLFSGNATGANTDGDIVLTSFFTGSASFSNVTITSDNADSGIRISGSSSSPGPAPPIALSNVTVKGVQRGAALAISRYTGGSNISFSNVTLNSTAPSGLHLGSFSGSLDAEGIKFSGNYSTVGSTPSFSVPNPGAIVLGKHRGASGSDATVSVDATFIDWSVTGLAAIEDRIHHHADISALGEVVYYGITLSDDGSNPMADGASYATITGTLTGLLYPSGNVISFTTDLGALSALTGAADTNGDVTTIITSTTAGMATITGTAGMAGHNPATATTTVTFVANTLDHFAFAPVGDQTAGVDFAITITAEDSSNVATAYNGDARLADTTGTVVPTTVGPFINGVWSGPISITQAIAGDVLTATHPVNSAITGASLPFTVQPSTAVAVTLTPDPETVTAGANVIYTVVATDAYGNSWNATSEASYDIDNGADGSWTNNIYTSESAGTWTVSTAVDGASDNASLTVNHGPATNINLTPNSRTITAGATASYAVWATDAYGNSWNATAEAAYSITAGAGGSWTNNVYTSEYAGTWAVRASVGGANDTATLTVNHGSATSVTLNPDPSTATAGDTVNYTVWATDAYGNSWNAAAEAAYDIDTGAGGSWTANVYTSEFAGTWTVSTTVDGANDTASLTVNHGPATSVTLTPDPETVTAGDTVNYAVWVTDAHGNGWDATTEASYDIDAGAGGVWTVNVYTSEFAGDWTVTATVDGANDTASLTVEVSTVATVTLTPASATITAGASITYTVWVTDTFDNGWDATADASYDIDAGAGGSWAINVYTLEFSGTWTVTASYGGKSDTASLTVNHAALDYIALSPSTATITAGERITYTVKAFDAHGNSWNVTSEAIYTIEDGAGGSWTGSSYTSEFANTWTVSATVDGAYDTAALTVQPGTAVVVTLAPASATITAGASITYTVWATDTFGNGWEATFEALYDIDDGAGGSWTGNSYTSEFVSTWTVSATVDGAYSNASLTVNHAALDHIALSPNPATITAGQSQSYTVKAFDVRGNSWNVTPAAVYTIENGAGGSWAINIYTSEFAGTWTVSATVDGATDTASLTVQPGPAVAVTVVPASATISAGASITYTVWATDTFGNGWDATAEAWYDIDAGAGGSWTTNVYTSELAGTWTVSATVDGVNNNANLTVNHAEIDRVELSPDPAAITAGQSQTYTVAGFDAYDNSWDVTAAAAYTITLGAGGSWTDNVYTLEFIGTWTVSATVDGAYDTASLTVQPGAAVAVALVPASATITAGESITYTVWATDTFDNGWDATAEAFYDIDTGAGGSWTGNVYTSAKAGDWTVTATTNGAVGAASLTVTPDVVVARFVFDHITDQTVGMPFTVTVTAYDAYTNIVVAFDGTVALTGAISPTTSGSFISGVWSGPVVIGVAATNVAITATDGAIDGVSNSFDVNNLPVLTSLDPISANAGGPSFPLTVNGTGFVVSSTVHWNGEARATAFISSTQLTAAITADDIDMVGGARVTVINPMPGGGTSNGLSFEIIELGPQPPLILYLPLVSKNFRFTDLSSQEAPHHSR